MEHVKTKSLHVRRGSVNNAFKYSVDYVFIDMTAQSKTALFSRNRFNLWSLWDRNHGGPRENGQGVAWFKDALSERGFAPEDYDLRLLTQPSFLGYTFNPVSFWVAFQNGAPHAIIAEVNNTFGHRHCYFCAHPDRRAIVKSDRLTAEKLMHVSPFQKVEGTYYFNFSFDENEIQILINYRNGEDGVFATLEGTRHEMSSLGLFWAALRRPFGALRVVALIHWQAIKLWVKKAPFKRKPPPPSELLSNGNEVRDLS